MVAADRWGPLTAPLRRAIPILRLVRDWADCQAAAGWQSTFGVPANPALQECWVMKYRVYLEQDEDGVFVATCPALPGRISQSQTRAEAAENIREAIEGYIVSLKKPGDRRLRAYSKKSSNRSRVSGKTLTALLPKRPEILSASNLELRMDCRLWNEHSLLDIGCLTALGKAESPASVCRLSEAVYEI